MRQFKTLLNEFFNLAEAKRKNEIEEIIWKKYGGNGYVMIMDMSDFSLITQRHGIICYLSMIEKMKTVVEPIISVSSGKLVKFVADSVFASFNSIEDAINASIEINRALNKINKNTPTQQDISVSIGIDYGRFLQTIDGDIFGDSVNCASKLGEDIAQKGEVIISKKAYVNLPDQSKYISESVKFNISGISIEAYSLNSCNF